MPIRIEKVDQEKRDKVHIRPVDMLLYPDRIFRQYSNQKPEETYYIHCGVNESNLIMIWFDEESCTYRFSTESAKSLKNLRSHVTAVDVTDEIDIFVEIKTYDSLD